MFLFAMIIYRVLDGQSWRKGLFLACYQSMWMWSKSPSVSYHFVNRLSLWPLCAFRGTLLKTVQTVDLLFTIKWLNLKTTRFSCATFATETSDLFMGWLRFHPRRMWQTMWLWVIEFWKLHPLIFDLFKNQATLSL